MDYTSEKQPTALLEMHLDYDGGNTLQEAVRWSKFLSIVGIVCLGIYLLLVLIGGSYIAALVQQAFGSESAALIGLVFLIILVVLAVLVFEVVMLYRFSVLTRKGIDMQDQASFNRGLKSLKIYFVINAIIGILYLLVTIFSTVVTFIF